MNSALRALDPHCALRLVDDTRGTGGCLQLALRTPDRQPSEVGLVEIPKKPKDYGHILPVELLSGDRPVDFQKSGMAAGLCLTMRNPSRPWNLDQLGAQIHYILRNPGKPPEAVDVVGKRLDTLFGLEVARWKRLNFYSKGAEFGAPGVHLLERVTAMSTSSTQEVGESSTIVAASWSASTCTSTFSMRMQPQ